ncbi:MAG: thrombospondin type 3 repeat-containing protein, partial [Euryarchaeota archaeon]|nr:thrombospondin type 3 repeat-containing protein [Euryarchaeota archaeon]
ADQCPNTPSGATVDANGCAMEDPPADSDNDGVADEVDVCPNTPAGVTVDAVGCEVSDPSVDRDGDGVIDSNDDCPNTAIGAQVDSTGCEITANGENKGISITNYSLFIILIIVIVGLGFTTLLRRDKFKE